MCSGGIHFSLETKKCPLIKWSNVTSNKGIPVLFKHMKKTQNPPNPKKAWKMA